MWIYDFVVHYYYIHFREGKGFQGPNAPDPFYSAVWSACLAASLHLTILMSLIKIVARIDLFVLIVGTGHTNEYSWAPFLLLVFGVMYVIMRRRRELILERFKDRVENSNRDFFTQMAILWLPIAIIMYLAGGSGVGNN